MVNDDASPDRGSGRALKDGRRQLLVFLPPDLIKSTKRRALDHDTSASAIVEEALHEWHERHAPGGNETG